jgi:hypothetical protein
MRRTGSGNLIDDPNAQQTISDLDALIAQERESSQRKANENAEVTFRMRRGSAMTRRQRLEATKKAEPPPPKPQQDSGQQ